MVYCYSTMHITKQLKFTLSIHGKVGLFQRLDCGVYSRETTLAEVADTFRESIIDQRFDHYTEIIIWVHEHTGAKNENDNLHTETGNGD